MDENKVSRVEIGNPAAAIMFVSASDVSVSIRTIPAGFFRVTVFSSLSFASYDLAGLVTEGSEEQNIPNELNSTSDFAACTGTIVTSKAPKKIKVCAGTGYTFRSLQNGATVWFALEAISEKEFYS